MNKTLDLLDSDAEEVIWQIGAHFGVECKWHAENNPNWTFHLFEPNPEAYRTLVNNFYLLPNVSLYKLAVVDHSSRYTDFYIPTKPNGEEWFDQVAGLTPTVANGFGLEPKRIKVAAVPYWRLAHITRSLPSCILIDTEGEDYRFFPLIKNRRPKIVQFEFIHMSSHIEKCYEQLRAWDYSFGGRRDIDEIWLRNS